MKGECRCKLCKVLDPLAGAPRRNEVALVEQVDHLLVLAVGLAQLVLDAVAAGA